MKDFVIIFPPAGAFQASQKAPTMEHVRIQLGPQHYLQQALRTLQSHLDGACLSTVPASVEWFEQIFPKPRSRIHPRPDLDQKIAPYMKWRQDMLRAVKIGTGARTEKEERSKREDGWGMLLSGIKFHTSGAGILHKASGATVPILADICRKAGIEPWDLHGFDGLCRLENAIAVPSHRMKCRSALKFLQKYRFIDEFAEVLPREPLVELLDLPGKSGEHQLRNQEVFYGKREQTDAGVSA